MSRASAGPDDQAQAVEYHHERADGNGYYGIAPTDVPLGAHFLIIADSFDAMVSDRSYRRGLPVETALAEIERCSGAQFHPAVAKAFVALQRGLDPVAALAPEELAEIRRLAAVRSRRTIRLDGVLTPGLVQGTGLLAALAAFGLGLPLLVVPALAVAGAGMALTHLDAVSARRLATDLREVLSGSAPMWPSTTRARGACGLRGSVAAHALLPPPATFPSRGLAVAV